MHLGRPTMSLEEGKVPGQLLSVTVSSVGPFNTWQEIQRGIEEKERREAELLGEWNDGADQNKLFLVSLGCDRSVSDQTRVLNSKEKDQICIFAEHMLHPDL